MSLFLVIRVLKLFLERNTFTQNIQIYSVKTCSFALTFAKGSEELARFWFNIILSFSCIGYWIYADVSNCIGAAKIKNNQFYSIEGLLESLWHGFVIYLKWKDFKQLLQKCKNFETRFTAGLLLCIWSIDHREIGFLPGFV